ncbi:Obg-like ATPase 1 [Cucurbita argyrosperma subsp. argyrosperma]|nr:Obg-like ATPase 1 [Cucurbita argyrosperma subsp. argyrosperma]
MHVLRKLRWSSASGFVRAEHPLQSCSVQEMPPKASKSKETPAERPILGRFSSHLKIGIVGFPFCTIEPHEARVNVPDEQFEWLCNLYKPKSECPSKDHKDWVLVDQSHIFLHCRS